MTAGGKEVAKVIRKTQPVVRQKGKMKKEELPRSPKKTRTDLQKAAGHVKREKPEKKKHHGKTKGKTTRSRAHESLGLKGEKELVGQGIGTAREGFRQSEI